MRDLIAYESEELASFVRPQAPEVWLFLNTAYERAQFKFRFIFSPYLYKTALSKSEILKITSEIARPVKEKK